MKIQLDAVEEKYIEAKAQLNNCFPEQYARSEILAMHEIISTRRRLLQSYQAENVNQIKIQDLNLYYRNLGSLIDDILAGYHLDF